MRSGSTSLAIYDPRLLGGPGPTGPQLVWRIDVVALNGLFDELVLVDAATGRINLHFDKYAEAKNRKVCDRNNVVGGAEACTTGAVRTEGQGPSGITDVDHAYDFAGETYDFYFSKFGRDSLNNAGLPLNSTTRFCPDFFNCPFQNAFWNGSQMVYGDGFPVDDVVGHELTHGVTDFESSLYYYGQSGAINESLSDVFGEFVDLSNTAGGGDDSAAARWKIGEDIGAIRDMKNPPAFRQPGPDAEHALRLRAPATKRASTPTAVSTTRPRILMTDGDTFNGKTVTGLGIDKVARIYYEAEVHLLTSGSDYADLYDILQQACKNLTGTSGITAANCTQVKNAVDATQMNLLPVTGAQTAQAPLCAAGQIPSNKFFDNLENTGSGNWTKTKVAGTTDWQYPVSGDTENATSGTQNFFGADPGDATSDLRISRTANVAVPATGTTFLRFNHLFDLEFQFDGGVVEYSTNNGTTYVDAGPLFNSNGYNSTIDSTARVRWPAVRRSPGSSAGTRRAGSTSRRLPARTCASGSGSVATTTPDSRVGSSTTSGSTSASPGAALQP